MNDAVVERTRIFPRDDAMTEEERTMLLVVYT